MANEIGYHIRMSLEDRRVIVASVAQLRELARSVLRACEGKQLLSFRCADTHLHLLVACARAVAGALARSIGKSITQRLRLPLGFGQPHFEAIRDQRHLNSAFWYDLRQDERHEIDIDPWAEASNLPDLLGLRLVGRYTTAVVGRFLPRVRPEGLARRLGLSIKELVHGPVSPESIDQAADAAAASVAAPALCGSSAAVVQARRAAVQLLDGSVSIGRLATLLGTTTRNVRRLRVQPVEPLLVEAVRRQLRLRSVRSVQREPGALLCSPVDPGDVRG